MRAWAYNLLDQLVDRLIGLMMAIEPRHPRRPEIDYHVTELPEHILAIIRTTWYQDGRPLDVGEVAILDDGAEGFRAFALIVNAHANAGANIGIQSSYAPQDMGLTQ